MFQELLNPMYSTLTSDTSILLLQLHGSFTLQRSEIVLTYLRQWFESVNVGTVSAQEFSSASFREIPIA